MPPGELRVASLTDVLQERAQRQPDHTAFVFLKDGETEEEAATFGKLDEAARRIGAALQQRGARPGDRMLLVFPPGLEFIRTFFGCLYGGTIPVPVYPPGSRRDTDTLRSIVADAEPTLLLTTEPLREAADAVFPAGSSPEVVVAEGDDSCTGSPAPIMGRDDIALLQYTSGSTGTPKGVKLTHGNLLENQRMIHAAFGHSAESVVVGWLPLYHDMGLIGNVMQPVYAGIPAILMTPMAFVQRPERWLRAISRYRGTTSGGPNFSYELCVRKIPEEVREELDLSSWTVAFNGAEPVRSDTLASFASRFAGCGFHPRALYPCYGLAEACLIVSGGDPRRPPSEIRLDTVALSQDRVRRPEGDGKARTLIGCGKAVAGEEILIVDPDSLEPMGAEQIGEIWVRGPNVAQGYWGRPDATREVFDAHLRGVSSETGFLRTGDLGFLSEGELYVTGRIKDLVIIRGRNHHPHDIELSASTAHPALRPGCCAAFHVEGEENGEALAIVQELSDVSQAEAALHAIREAVVRDHAVRPAVVVLIPKGSLPKTSSGKVRRRFCRDLWCDGRIEAVLQWAEASPVIPGGAEEMAGTMARDGDLRLRVAAIVGEQLSTSPSDVEPDVPLVRLGLDSMRALQLQHELQRSFGVDIPLSHLLGHSTVASIARSVCAAPMPPSMRRAPDAAADALSWGEKALWFQQHLDARSTSYVIARAVAISGPLDVDALRRAIGFIVERHASLRTGFANPNGEPIRQVHPTSDTPLVVEAAGGLDDDALRRRMSEVVAETVDLERGPIARFQLYARAPDEHVLLMLVHHIAADMWSLYLLCNELESAYVAACARESVDLERVDDRYPAFVRWQQAMLNQSGEQLAAYWMERLGESTSHIGLPRASDSEGGQGGGRHRFDLGAETSAWIRREAEGRGTTPYVILMAAFQVLLSRYAGSEDFLIASPMAGRPAKAFDRAVGYFANLVLVRADMRGDPTFRELVGRVRETMLGALDHQHYPFAQVVQRLRPQREPGRMPLFEVAFSFLEMGRQEADRFAPLALERPGEVVSLADLELRSFDLQERPSFFDFALSIGPTQGGFSAIFEYGPGFSPSFAGRLAEEFCCVLRACLQAPGLPISGIDLLPASERRRLIACWSGSAARSAAAPDVIEAWRRAAADRGNQVALTSSSGSLSHAELLRRAEGIALSLRKRGVGRDSVVGVAAGCGADRVVAVLGVLIGNGAYLPLDPDLPEERLAYMMEDSGAAAIVVDEYAASRLPPSCGPVIRVEPPPLPRSRTPMESVPAPRPEQLAYVIYTSGSTGTPKGVGVSREALATFLASIQSILQLDEHTVMPQITSLSFDIAALEIFLPLLAGATIAAPDPQVVRDGRLLGDFLDRSGATVMQATPSTWQLLLETDWANERRIEILSGGEALQGPLAERLLTLSDVVWNLYGPTEATVWATASRLRPGTEVVSVGRPLANTRVFVLDARFEPVPIGAVGELYLAGSGLARAYVGMPEETADAFLPNPFPEVPGERIYRTGDRARFLPDGQLQLLGRRDDQVKIRGHRVQLGEIEAVLVRFPGVTSAAVNLQRRSGMPDLLVAFLVLAAGAAAPEERLRGFLGRRLPTWMIPSVFVHLDSLPLTASRKIDRRDLPEVRSYTLPREKRVAPSTPTERTLCEIWSEVLGTEPPDIEADFFESGGDSLGAMRIINRIERRLGPQLSVRSIFEHRSIAALALVCDENAHHRGDERERARRLFRLVRGMSEKEIRAVLDSTRKGSATAQSGPEPEA